MLLNIMQHMLSHFPSICWWRGWFPLHCVPQQLRTNFTQANNVSLASMPFTGSLHGPSTCLVHDDHVCSRAHRCARSPRTRSALTLRAQGVQSQTLCQPAQSVPHTCVQPCHRLRGPVGHGPARVAGNSPAPAPARCPAPRRLAHTWSPGPVVASHHR